MREAVWHSWYKNDEVHHQALVPANLIAIDPGEEAWKSKTEFLASSRDFAAHHGRLLSLRFLKTQMQMFGHVAVLYSLYEVRFEYDGTPQMLSGRTTEVPQREQGTMAECRLVRRLRKMSDDQGVKSRIAATAEASSRWSTATRRSTA